MNNVKTKAALNATWPLVRRTIERRARRVKAATGLSLPRATSRVLQRDPALWEVYRAAMAAGHAPEFVTQQPEWSRARKTAWLRIERAARELLASSDQPMTLVDAMERVVRRHPAWYERYAQLKG